MYSTQLTDAKDSNVGSQSMLLLMALTHLGDRDVFFVKTVASCKNSSACAVASKEAAKMLREKCMGMLYESENEQCRLPAASIVGSWL